MSGIVFASSHFPALPISILVVLSLLVYFTCVSNYLLPHAPTADGSLSAPLHLWFLLFPLSQDLERVSA